MRSLFLILSLFCLNTVSANSPQEFLNDQVYVMLDEQSASLLINSKGQINEAGFNEVFYDILEGIKIHSVSVPFYTAQESVLQQVLNIQLGETYDLDALVSVLATHPAVVYAEKIPYIRHFDTYNPDDLGKNSSSGQWYLHKINAPEAWYIGKGNKQIKIAITDDAVDIDHPDLSANIWTNEGEIPDNGIDDDNNGYIDDVHGYDVADNDADPRPSSAAAFHGTHVSGLAGASTNNGQGIASIGFDVSIIAVKCSRDRSGSFDRVYEGITYAVAAGADIINCSWGTFSYSNTHRKVVEHAIEKGCIVVAAAGNENQQGRCYPAAYPGVVSVASTTNSDRVSPFSNYGSWITVCAPGTNVRSTLPNNSFGVLSGTSMSTPIVSGLLGLMKAHHPAITAEELRDCLLHTTDSIEHINSSKYTGKVGSGRINAYRSMKCVDNHKKGITGIKKPYFEKDFLIYPVPAKSELFLELKGPAYFDGKIFISDITGRMVVTQDCGKKTLERIDVSHLQNGIYILQVKKHNYVFTEKIEIIK